MVKSSSEIKNMAGSIVSCLKQKGVKVNRLILFGSYANGRAHTYSDIDIAVISTSFNSKNILQRQELLGEAIYVLQEPIEASGYSYREFKKHHRLSFLSEIISKGKVIYKESR